MRSKLKIVTTFILAFIAVLIGFSVWQNLSGIDIGASVEIASDAISEFSGNVSVPMPSGWWTFGLFAVVGIGALPFLLALGLDGKGQAAAGWLLFFGAIVSVFAVTIFFLIYMGGSLLYLIYDLIFN